MAENNSERAAPLKLGLIGLDTSHVVAFAELLHNPGHPYHVPGAVIETAYSRVSPNSS